ncbi:cell number regulator 10-like [Macadamia integrifolia]|uniref:cell number regulator 10-like n=1 Tax=Macadamia integrifolia TaxID=60698 RepID=UPI001C4E8B13|nr:cell number regulator 10-like [Macadamia integrifolia]
MYSSEKSDDQKSTPASSATTAPATGTPVSSAPAPWSSGLCDCFTDLKSCCLTFWCPCVAFGQISEIVDEGSSSCVLNGAIYALILYCTGGCQFWYSCCYRSKMRGLYNLEEGPCGDCLVHFCCEPCAICQEYRELESRGFDVCIGWHANIAKKNRELAMPPVVQEGMTR